MSRDISKASLFKELTWDDLQDWAGSRVLSRGQGYHRDHRVKGLAQTQKGSLVAWVHGGQKYATEVGFKNEELISVCTCPYGNNCKHAVAVVLEYLDHLKKNIEVPQVAKQDQRLSLLENYPDEVAWDDDDDDEEEEEEEEEEDGEYEEMGDTENLSSKKVVKPTQTELKGFLEEQSREQLIALIEDMAERHSVVREDLRDRCHYLSRLSERKNV